METLYLLVLVVAAGVGAQWIAARLHVPAILLLLFTGIALGRAGTGLLDPDVVFGDLRGPFISLAVALVLFEGGLSLHLREARHVGPTLWKLIVSGLIIGFGLVTVLGVWVAGLETATAAVLGAILVVTGPTVIIPMLRGARIAFRPAALLKWEGIVNDPFGALLAILTLLVVLQFAKAGSYGVVSVVLGFVGWAILTGLLGGFVGWLLGKALDSQLIPEDLKSPVMLAAVLGVFAGAEWIQHENGLLAVTAMGLVLANVEAASLEDIRHFKEQVSTLLIGFLFIVLSAELQPESLEALIGTPLLLIALILFVVRPIVVAVATFRSPLPWNERALLGWIAPRGVVAAAMAGAFAPRLETEAGCNDAHLLVPIVFGVILATVVLHGLSIRPLARKLGLGAGTGNGILVVGASTWAVALAQALARAGAFVTVADTRYRRVARARLEGLDVHFGDVLSDETALEIPLERISWLIATTLDDSYNSLVCMNFGRDLPRTNVLQVTPSQSAGSAKGKDVGLHMSGRSPWGDVASYRSIAQRFWRGAGFKVTQTSEQFTWEQLREQKPDALFLFYVHQDKLGILAEDNTPPVGAKVVYLAEQEE